jgi:dipeptidase D
MNEQVRQLNPSALWQNFADLNAIPRPSKKEQRVIQFMTAFGEILKLPVIVDGAGNVLISKPASRGFENRTPIVLQSHLDMVHQKNSGTGFDFANSGIIMEVSGDWVKAAGTTLGADNGIGVAAIMSILASDSIEHPPLQALFTIDEETGMTGAMALKGGLLKGKILLNLDTEDDTEITIGCAGGLDITASFDYEEVVPENDSAFSVTVKGLTGGHSGLDIHLGRGNANKILNRLLYLLLKENLAEVSVIDGGSLRNAIPREAGATIVVKAGNAGKVTALIDELRKTVQKEYAHTDPALQLLMEKAPLPGKVIDKKFLLCLIRSIYSCPSGIYRMSSDIQGLVQSSNNLAKVNVAAGKFQAQCLCRSSVDSEKLDLYNAIASAFESCGAKVVATDGYPGWTPDPSSAILQLMKTIYLEKFGKEPHVSAVHAGLECGILGRNYPGMQMVSFGPNIRGAHSPDEKVQISSVQKFWDYLLEILRRIPVNP